MRTHRSMTRTTWITSDQTMMLTRPAMKQMALETWARTMVVTTRTGTGTRMGTMDEDEDNIDDIYANY